MAIQETRTLPAPFIEDIGKDFAKNLIGVTGLPALAADISGQLTKRTDPATGKLETDEAFENRQRAAKERFQTFQQTQAAQAPFAPKVAGQDPLQTRAAELAGQGVGSFQEFIDRASLQGAFAGAQTGLASAGISGAEGMLGSGAGTGTGTIQDFMSPFQQQVIDTTLGEFDRNRAIQEQTLRDQQAKLGVLGSGRAGVQLAEYGSSADRERALLQAGLLQQGFNQAQQARQQDFTNRFGIFEAQTGLAGAVPQLQRADIASLGQVGAAQQLQQQRILDAQAEANRLQAFEPQSRLDTFGRGIAQLISGYPGSSQVSQTPNLTPLQTALGVAATVGGLFGDK